MLSNKVTQLGFPKSIAVAEAAANLKSQGVDIIDLSIGQPDFFPPISMTQLESCFHEAQAHRYSNSLGLGNLRDIIAKQLSIKHKVSLQSEQVVITPGAKSALYYLLASLVDKDSTVIVPEPSWLSYTSLAGWNENKIVTLAGTESERFLVSNEAILNAVDNHSAKVVLINSPINPTGVAWPIDQLRELYNELCRRKVFMILDAIYDDFLFSERSVLLSDFSKDEIPKYLVYVHGFSKTFSLSGHRLGYVVASREIVTGVGRVQSQLNTCPSTFSQYLAIEMLSNLEQHYYDKIRDTYSSRSHLAQKQLSESGIEYIEPDGTFYLMMNSDFIAPKSVQAASIILDKCNVAVVPGEAYGKCTDGYVRLSLIQPKELVLEALSRIAALKK